jgi:hypothetical protein
VVRLGLEAAVVCPEVDRDADASDTALVYLHLLACAPNMPSVHRAYHFCCLRPCDRELHVCISLPEAIEQRVSREESIVCLPGRGDCLRARVAIQATFLRFGGANKFLPVLKFFRIGCLYSLALAFMSNRSRKFPIACEVGRWQVLRLVR